MEEVSGNLIEKINEAVDFIKSHNVTSPRYGIVLGTGLGALVNEMKIEKIINYDEIPHFPVSTVEFHSGKLMFGRLADKPVVVMQGRFHFYEGYSMKEVTFPIRVMKLLGIEKLFMSNAAGGLNESFNISDLMIINDHINLMTQNPLTGKNLDEFGGRFTDMYEPYDFSMVHSGLKIAKELGIQTHEGVYAAVPGPNLETRAEYRYLSIIGADAVGMSTVPEIIVARHMEIPCFAVSVITDLCYPSAVEKIDIQKIIAAAHKAEPGLTKLITRLIGEQDS
ncbi:MAG: purine-nucleoside phosphorylase [Cyclobacteriaceae bacterium]